MTDEDPAVEPDETWMTVVQAAAALSVHDRTVTDWIRTGKLVSIFRPTTSGGVPGRPRSRWVAKSSVDRVLAERCPPGPTLPPEDPEGGKFYVSLGRRA